MSLKQPVTQVRLTNVAIVRYKHAGHRFEVACYKNKIVDYRNGNENDLNEVLQTVQVFSNVSKGITANKSELRAAFEDVLTDLSDASICQYICAHGEIQVSEKERQVEYENKYREIAVLITNTTVNRDTGRPFSVSMIEATMKQIHVNINLKKNVKSQALEIVRQLKSVLSTLQRAQMRVRILMPTSIAKAVKSKVQALIAQVEQESYEYEYDATVIIDPGQFRALEELVQRECKGRGRIDILDHKVLNDDVVGDDQLTSIDDIKPLTAHRTAASDEVAASADNTTYLPTLAPVIDDDAPMKRKKGKAKQHTAPGTAGDSVASTTAALSHLSVDRPLPLKTNKQLKKQAKKQQQLLAQLARYDSSDTDSQHSTNGTHRVPHEDSDDSD